MDEKARSEVGVLNRRVLGVGKNGTEGLTRIPLMLQPGSSVLPSSLCLLADQPPSSAKSAFSFSMQVSSHLTPCFSWFHTLIISNLHCLCLLFLLSFFVCHPYAIARVIFPQRELSLLSWHLFNSSSATIEILCYQQSKQDALFSAPPPHIPLVTTPTSPPFTIAYIAAQHSGSGSVEMLAVYQFCALSVPQFCQIRWCHCMFLSC